jgi:hypothetical protein
MFLPSTKRAGYYALCVFSLLLLIGFIVLDMIEPGGRRLVKVKGIDTVNYFGISHSLLFDHDFNLNNEFTHIAPDSRIWSEVQKTGLPGSVWGPGYSILEMPFLATGTLFDAIAGRPADGYSRGAIYAYCLGNVIFTGLGLLALYSLLYRVGESRGLPPDRLTRYSLFVTLAIFLGTNVGYYAFPQIAHASTFLFASMFLAWWWKIRSGDDSRSWALLGLIGGFLSICRWQDIVFLGGPALFDLLNGTPWKTPRAWLRSRTFYAAAAGVCWIPQIIEWKVIYGKYLTIPQGSGFIVFPPAHIRDVLLSSRNGWLMWTPLIAFGIAGLLYGAFRFTRDFLPWIAVVVIEIVVIGSLPTWHGYDSFSSRYLLTTTPVIALGLFTLLCSLNSAMRRALAVATAACCVFTILFAAQFRLDLIPSNETLTFNEVFTDKLHPLAVRRKKAAARQAGELLARGNAQGAVQVLEQVASGEADRDVLAMMSKAYRAEGNEALARVADSRSQQLLDSRLK